MLRSSMLLALLAATGFIAPARADTTDCTRITSLPATLTTPGTYCLAKNFGTSMTTGAAITIASSGVVLDCNAFRVDDLAAGTATQAVGIQVSNRNHVTIRQCHVRGFRIGIALSGRNATIEDNFVSRSTTEGMRLTAHASTVRGNRVQETGSTKVASAVAIRNDGGTSLQVVDNVISGVTSSTLSYGVLSTGRDGVIEGNRLSNLVGPSGVRGFSVSQARTVVRDNHVQVKPATAGFAVRVNDNGEAGQAICSHNIALGFAGSTPWSTCFDHYNDAY